MTMETLVVRVPSQTDPAVSYTLHAAGPEQITCSCRGYLSHHHCKHQTALGAVLREEKMTTDQGTAVVKHEAPLPASINATAMVHVSALPKAHEFDMMVRIAGTVIKAKGMVPENIATPEQAMAVMLAGRELGLKPMTSLRHVYIVNGKTDIETRAMVGIVRANAPGIRFEWPEYTREAVTCILRRPGQADVTVRYTVEDAKASGQYEGRMGIWKKYTRDMLYAAATKRACRMGAPDLINAIDSAMQSVEAVGAAMDGAPAPETTVRVLEQHEQIPADAYNDGDHEGALPPEAQEQPEAYRGERNEARRAAMNPMTEAPTSSGMRAGVPVQEEASYRRPPTPAEVLRDKLNQLKRADPDMQKRITEGIVLQYPHSAGGIDQKGMVIGKLTPEEQQACVDLVRAALGEAVGEQPPAQAPLTDPDDVPFV